jgi:hypothetical protein
VDDMERYLMYGMGMWIAWKGTLCMKWDCGWFGKVPGVRVGFVVSSCLNKLRTGS